MKTGVRMLGHILDFPSVVRRLLPISDQVFKLQHTRQERDVNNFTHAMSLRPVRHITLHHETERS